MINPITIRPRNDGYEVVAGHRRFQACKIAGIIEIPCVVRELTDTEAFAVMAAENLEREDVDPVDEAIFIKEYMERTGEDAEQTAKRLRRSQQYVVQRLMIAEMPDYVKQYLKEDKIKLGVALALGQIDNEVIRKKWVDLAAEQGISVRTAEFQLLDYRTNKKMYDGIIEENADSPDVRPPLIVKFVCAVTGAEVDSRLGGHVWISEEARPIFDEFVRLYKSDPAQTEFPPGEHEVATGR